MTKNPDELRRRVEALEERGSKLCGAVGLVCDGDSPMVLKGEDARALLALPDLSAPGLDLAVGSSAHVGVVPRAAESRGCDGT